MGRFGEAMDEIERAQLSNRSRSSPTATSAWHLFFQRRYDDAIAQLEETLRMDPTIRTRAPARARAGRKGRYTEAFEHLQTAAPAMARGVNLSFVAYVQAISGDLRAADASMAQVEKRRRSGRSPDY